MSESCQHGWDWRNYGTCPACENANSMTIPSKPIEQARADQPSAEISPNYFWCPKNQGYREHLCCECDCEQRAIFVSRLHGIEPSAEATSESARPPNRDTSASQSPRSAGPTDAATQATGVAGTTPTESPPVTPALAATPLGTPRMDELLEQWSKDVDGYTVFGTDFPTPEMYEELREYARRLKSELSAARDYEATLRKANAALDDQLKAVQEQLAEARNFAVAMEHSEAGLRADLEDAQEQLAAERTAREGAESNVVKQYSRADVAESVLASLADTVASALRNTGMSDAGVSLNCDLREFVWSLSYTANERKRLAEIAEAESARLKEQIAAVRQELEMCDGEIPEHKRNDAEFLRATVASLNSYRRSAIDRALGRQ